MQQWYWRHMGRMQNGGSRDNNSDTHEAIRDLHQQLMSSNVQHFSITSIGVAQRAYAVMWNNGKERCIVRGPLNWLGFSYDVGSNAMLTVNGITTGRRLIEVQSATGLPETTVYRSIQKQLLRTGASACYVCRFSRAIQHDRIEWAPT